MRSLHLRRAARTSAGATVVAGTCLGLLGGTAAAQGSLSGQGYGYPTGQLSTRALGTGGGLAEFDPVSPLNPASLTLYGRTAFAFQYDPEFRTTTVGSAVARNTIARFPVVAIGVPFRQRFTFGFSASTFLDRSFTTTDSTATSVGDSTVSARETVESRGSISDLRLGVGAVVTRWLQVGVAVHRLTGNNRLVTGRQFYDTTNFGSITDSTTLSFTGSAFSAGALVSPVRGLSLAGSVRRGGSMRAEFGDTVVGRGTVPNRYGLGLRVDRITGATIAASYARTIWSSMNGLGSSRLDARDTHELMGGIEALGPSVGAAPVILRLGARQRTLPFAIDGAQIRETAYTGGLGLPLAGGRAVTDLTLQRALRSAVDEPTALSGVRERAWTLSLGFTLRP